MLNLVNYKNSIQRRECEKLKEFVGAVEKTKLNTRIFDNIEEVLTEKIESGAEIPLNPELDTKIAKKELTVDKLSRVSNALEWKKQDLVL